MAQLELQRTHGLDDLPDLSLLEWLQHDWEPALSCGGERRVGDMGDGGKWVCDPHRIGSGDARCLVYSVGSNNQFDFEEALYSVTGCEIHTFDPTIGDDPSGRPDFVAFHPWGLGAGVPDKNPLTDPHPQQDSVEPGPGAVLSLSEITRALNHATRAIDVLKIDCEGCEFEVLGTLAREALASRREHLLPRQILVEMHVPGSVGANEMLRLLHEAGYVIFHKEINLIGKPSSDFILVEFGLIRPGLRGCR